MRKISLLFVLFFILNSVYVYAADTLMKFPLSEALKSLYDQGVISETIPLYWGDQPHPPVIETYGSYSSSKRTRGLLKSSDEACSWALASVVKVLQERVENEGGNAVINLKSNIKNKPVSSQTEFSCLVGTVVVNVALSGEIVKINSDGSTPLRAEQQSRSNTQVSAANNTSSPSSKTQELQLLLIEAGYNPGPADGYMGKKTQDALKKFQKDNNLPITGNADNDTYAKLQESKQTTPDEKIADENIHSVSQDPKPDTQEVASAPQNTPKPSPEINIKIIEATDLLQEMDLYGADILATIPANSQLRIIDKSEEFYKVKYNGKLGYIYCEFAEELK